MTAKQKVVKYVQNHQLQVDTYSVDNVHVQEHATYGSNGLLSSITKFGADGHVKEQDRFQYSRGVLTELDRYAPDGTLIERDFYANGALAKTVAISAQGITQTDYNLRNGGLRDVLTYGTNGLEQTATLYGPDGKTIVEQDAFSYTGTTLTGVTAIKPTASGGTETDTYSPAGNRLVLTQAVIADSTGRVTEVDKFSYLATMPRDSALENRYDAAGNLLETDVLMHGQVAKASIYNADNTLASVTTYSGRPGHVALEVDTYNHGTLAQVQYNNGLGLAQSVDVYSSDGTSITETDTFTYTAAHKVATETHYHGQTVFENDVFGYVNNVLTTETKYDGSGTLLETDYFNADGTLNHVVTAPVATTPATSPTPFPVPGAWDTTSGYGEVNVLNAVNLVTGTVHQAAATPTNLDWSVTTPKFQDAWANGMTGKGVVIADIDTGIDLTNPALTQHLSQYSWNFVNNSANVQDDNGHGTFTAGEMVAADTGNGVVGGAYDSTLMVLKALDAAGNGSDTDIASAINYAVNHGANVINLSLGASSPDAILQQALQYASAHNVIVCMAAGNEGSNTPDYPAGYAQTITNCIAVGADQQTSTGLSSASFSNHTGSTTGYNFVEAPGNNVLGYDLHGALGVWGGTSMASPLVAAECADLLSYGHGVTSSQAVQDVVCGAVALNLIGSMAVHH
ncbi:DNA ligase-associated DEXH box helicase [Novimethylophilus kurashikiensis]|uniref:DNA ligase-associated DEXH box helicase n=1 Tax=Novimethylophilus kurashikiensis TaxID=1825523 RepID=A0A2R5FD19_9PROT|nr:S8 family serine peptidase [Novimethylophilus kurashikiensis]GBG14524.1 DNA ligase-associated DEXH box helicase [Novimethylophilus kurashikiensis]